LSIQFSYEIFLKIYIAIAAQILSRIEELPFSFQNPIGLECMGRHAHASCNFISEWGEGREG